MTCRSLATLALAATITLFGGCSSAPPATYELDAPSTLEVIRGGAGSVPVTITRNETATLPLSLRVKQLPEGLTASFESDSLDGTQTETLLHIAADRDAQDGLYTLELLAEGERGLQLSQSIIVTVHGLNVEGRLTSIYNGVPLGSAASLRIGEREVSVSPDGTFYGFGLAIPYDVTVESEQVTEIFLSATHPEPKVIAAWTDPSSEPIFGRITGEVRPLPEPGEVIMVCPGHASALIAFGCASVHPDTGAYDLQVALLELEVRARIVARRLTSDGAGFSGHAEAEVRVSMGVTTSAPTLQLVASSSSAIPVALDMNGWSGEARASSWASFADGLALLGPPVLDGGSDAVLVPEGGLGLYEFQVKTATAGEATVARRIEGMLDESLKLPRPLEQVSPAPGAAVSADTEFVVALPEGGLVSHVFELDDRHVIVHTMADRLRLSDLPIPVQSSAIRTWRVTHSPEVRDMDHALSSPAAYIRVEQLSTGMVLPLDFEDVSSTTSAPRPLNAGT